MNPLLSTKFTSETAAWANQVQIIPDEPEDADNGSINTHNIVHHYVHAEKEVLQVAGNEINIESKPYPIEGMSRLIGVEKI